MAPQALNPGVTTCVFPTHCYTSQLEQRAGWYGPSQRNCCSRCSVLWWRLLTRWHHRVALSSYVLLLFKVLHPVCVSKAPGEILTALLKHFSFILFYELSMEITVSSLLMV